MSLPIGLLIHELHISGASFMIFVFALLEQARHQNPITNGIHLLGYNLLSHSLPETTLPYVHSAHKVRQFLQSAHIPDVATKNVDYRYSINRMILLVRLALTRA